jgi:hypothetical protein
MLDRPATTTATPLGAVPLFGGVVTAFPTPAGFRGASAAPWLRGRRRSAWVRAIGAMVAWLETAKWDAPMAPWWRGWRCQTASCAVGLVQVGIEARRRSVAAVVAEADRAR